MKVTKVNRRLAADFCWIEQTQEELFHNLATLENGLIGLDEIRLDQTESTAQFHI